MVLTKDKVEEVYIELREGTPMKSIAKMFGVSITCIQHYNKGRYYKVADMRYPIVDRRKKYGKEPHHGDPFWDTYEPEPMLHWPQGE
jgi:transposase